MSEFERLFNKEFNQGISDKIIADVEKEFNGGVASEEDISRNKEKKELEEKIKKLKTSLNKHRNIKNLRLKKINEQKSLKVFPTVL